MLNKIIDYLQTPKGQRNILAVALIAAIILMRGCGSDNSIEILKYEQNIAALNDSVRTYQTKNGDLIYEKLALIADKKELTKYNDDLKKDIKDLKDNPLVVIKYETVIVHDTVRVPVIIDTQGITWNSDSTIKYVPASWENDTVYNKDNYRKLGGDFTVVVDTSLNTVVQDFKVTKDEMGMSFTTGLTENDNDQVEIFIKSDYPGFAPTNINGALFDPRESDVIKKFFPPKRWAVGVYGGYGLYLDAANLRIGTGFQLGIGVQYNLFQWRGKK